ncbi:MAG: hypothetical protein M3Z85_09320 [Acidobacteriota bacterium]|nr:hypothetical protein [Acidobacteriota bacterium]
MKVALLVLISAALALSGADKKPKKPKPPDIEMLEVSAKRSEGLISIDSKVRNVGEKPIRGLTVIFEFFGPGHVPITTQKATVEEETLDKGEEAMIRAQLNDPVRAVSLEISAVDEPGHDLKVVKPGPYPIE